jgi:uncharacterized protein
LISLQLVCAHTYEHFADVLPLLCRPVAGTGTIEWGIGSIVALSAAGLTAGAINAVVGSGSLITFPTLVGLGLDKLPANVTNNSGLVSGSFSAVYGYRRELVGQQIRLRKLTPVTIVGACVGAALLLALPSKVFGGVVPFLVLLGVVLVAVAPTVQARIRAKKELQADATVQLDERLPWWLMVTVFLTGIYGGYFGAGQGVILTGVLGMGIDDDLRRINGTKNVLAAAANLVALLFFLVFRSSAIEWRAVAILAVSSTVGAQFGSLVGRRISPTVLRTGIVVLGLGVAFRLFTS